MELRVKKCNENAILPTQSYEEGALDLYSIENITIPVGHVVPVKTGIMMEIPVGYRGLIWPRSGMAVKKTSDIFAGVIDSDYRGEIGVCLYNANFNGVIKTWVDGMGSFPYIDKTQWLDNDLEIKVGDKIAQILIEAVPSFKLVEVDSLSDSERGSKGYGSSDLNG